MKHTILFITLICALNLSASAQGQRNMSPADALQTIVTNADGSVTFNIFAPTANQVKLEGDFAYLNAEFSKNADGIWTATVPKVNTDAYRYYFNVDGMKVIDPKYGLFSEIIPVAQITNGEDIFWSHRDGPTRTSQSDIISVEGNRERA